MTIFEDPRTNTEFAKRFSAEHPVVLGVTEVPRDTATIHLVEASSKFERLLDYPSVSALSINNVVMTAQLRRELEAAAPQLAKIDRLQIWNCAKFDLGLLSLFPAVRFLQLAHRNAQGSDWSQLSLLPDLTGLFLVDATKIADLRFGAHLGGTLTTLSILGARSLKSTSGVEHVGGSLVNLVLWGDRKHPPQKRVGPVSLSTLETLTRLHSLSVSGLDFDVEEFVRVVQKLNALTQLELDPWQFEMGKYAHMRGILPNVESAALQPYVDAGDSILPVGKGTKMLQRSSASFDEQFAMVLDRWKSASRAKVDDE